MPKNNIQKRRTKLGLSQRKLAELVGTSQQQIQRIEAGVQAARLEIATRICAALNAQMVEIFPQTKKVLPRLVLREDPYAELVSNERCVAEMGKAGIDTNPEFWHLRVRLRSRVEKLLPITATDQKRLWSQLQNRDTEFVVLDSGDKRVAINIEHLLCWQFLWDAEAPIPKKSEEDDGLYVFFSDSEKPLRFDVDADEKKLGKDDEGDEVVQLRGLLRDLERSDEDTIVSFEDSDGEYAFFRANEISMVELPLWAVEPGLEEGEDDEAEETEGNLVENDSKHIQ
jgi:DNA-binding XRE family transcriptional regulator